MKKSLLALMATATLTLAACGNDSTKEENTGSTVATESTKETEPETTATFKDGVLETENFKLTIQKSEVIKSPSEDQEGLFITYKLENTNDGDVIPRDTLDYLIATQENETSRVTLENNYYFLDAYGDDPKIYNKMVDIDNATANALLPGKTVEFQNAIYLDNREKPVVITANDDLGNEVGTYEIKVK